MIFSIPFPQPRWLHRRAGHISQYPYQTAIEGNQILPAVIARVMPDGTTWYQYHQRNFRGISTKVIEKWVENGSAQYRTNRYVYDSNGTDLLEHWSTHDGTEHREAGYSYNSYGLPLTYTNALGE